jgi:hypothetical protein
MHAVQRRQYEMLMRLRDFGHGQRLLFAASPTAVEAFGAVSATIDELTAADLLMRSVSVAARANHKAAARKALIALLVKVGKLARVLEARGHAIPPFRRPASKSDHVLLTLARQFARDAAACEEFGRHGIGAARITATADAFDAATRDRSRKQADTIAARARIRQLLASAALAARRLDVIVHFMVTDDVLRAVWTRVRRVENPRCRRREATYNFISSSRPPTFVDPSCASWFTASERRSNQSNSSFSRFGSRSGRFIPFSWCSSHSRAHGRS